LPVLALSQDTTLNKVSKPMVMPQSAVQIITTKFALA
jgi:hypothetical protein